MAELVKHITVSVLDCGSLWSANWVGNFSHTLCKLFFSICRGSICNTLPIPTALHYRSYVMCLVEIKMYKRVNQENLLMQAITCV